MMMMHKIVSVLLSICRVTERLWSLVRLLNPGTGTGRGTVKVFDLSWDWYLSRRGTVKVFELSGGLWSRKGSVVEGEEDGDAFGRVVWIDADGSRWAASPFLHNGNEGQERCFIPLKLLNGLLCVILMDWRPPVTILVSGCISSGGTRIGDKCHCVYGTCLRRRRHQQVPFRL